MEFLVFLRLLIFQVTMVPGMTWALTTITTSGKSKLTGQALQDFLATPSHWPDIVISSSRVESVIGSPASSKKKAATTTPLKRGASVEEFLGVAGLELLSVTWDCVESKPGTIALRSKDGIKGLAEDCSFRFNVSGEEVSLTVEYNPVSLLGVLAGPVLAVDNWMTLNLWLPAAVDPTPLESFRKLMGSLYGVAGLAHLADLILGPSTLLLAAGAPPYASLPVAGQAYALLWCATGPMSYFASRSERERVADLGLLFYGIVEVLGAYLTTSSDALVNAIVVQVVVGAAWLYSSKNQLHQHPKH